MVRLILAPLLALHGAVHVLGFVVPWKLAEPEGFSYSTTLLCGRIDVGDGGIRVIGVVWLLVALAFVGVGAGLWFRAAWWWPAALAVTAISLVLTVFSLPQAVAGVVLNVVLLGAILFVPQVRDAATTA